MSYLNTFCTNDKICLVVQFCGDILIVYHTISSTPSGRYMRVTYFQIVIDWTTYLTNGLSVYVLGAVGNVDVDE